MTDTEPSLEQLAEAAQRVAGVIGARQRADPAGVAALMSSFASDKALAGGALLLAELALGLYRQQTGQTMDQCIQEITLHLDAAARSHR
jgi:hypothetical protein